MSNVDTQRLLADCDLARQLLSKLCQADYRLRMCIPLQESDDDRVLSRVIEGARTMAVRVQALEKIAELAWKIGRPENCELVPMLYELNEAMHNLHACKT